MANKDPIAQSRDPLLGIDNLISEIFQMQAEVLGEAKVDQAAARKAAKEKKQAKVAARARAEKGRGKQFDNDKAEKHDDTKPRKVDTSAFRNDETFTDTPEDSHVHSGGKCNDTNLRFRRKAADYAVVGDSKNPCAKKYPKFPGRKEKARLLGSYKAALANKNVTAQRAIEKEMRAIGLHPKGHLYKDMPGCEKVRSGKHVPGLTAKMCKPHGEGGADEWARKHKSGKPEHEKHKSEPTARRKGFFGHRRGLRSLPKDASNYEKSYYAAGGRHGELKRGAERTLSKSEIAKRAGGSSPDSRNTNVSGARWHRLTKDKTGKKSA